MKTRPAIAALLFALTVSLASGAPISFDEISFLVRIHDSDASIAQQITQRRLLQALTPQQEATLKAEGAPDALIQALRNPNVRLSDSEASAFETRREQQKKVMAAAATAQEATRAEFIAKMRGREAEEATARVTAQPTAQIVEPPSALPRSLAYYAQSPHQPSFYPLPIQNSAVSNNLVPSLPNIVSTPVPIQSTPHFRGYMPSQSTYQPIGNSTYGFNDGVTQRVGGLGYQPNSTSAQSYTSTQIGKTTYFSGGGSTMMGTQIGNTTYYNGAGGTVTATQIGKTTYYNGMGVSGNSTQIGGTSYYSGTGGSFTGTHIGNTTYFNGAANGTSTSIGNTRYYNFSKW